MPLPVLLMSAVQRVGLNLYFPHTHTHPKVAWRKGGKAISGDKTLFFILGCVLNGNNTHVEAEQREIFMLFGPGGLPF